MNIPMVEPQELDNDMTERSDGLEYEIGLNQVNQSSLQGELTSDEEEETGDIDYMRVFDYQLQKNYKSNGQNIFKRVEKDEKPCLTRFDKIAKCLLEERQR